MSAFVELLGKELLKGTEKVATEKALGEADAVLVYFSAHWSV